MDLKVIQYTSSKNDTKLNPRKSPKYPENKELYYVN